MIAVEHFVECRVVDRIRIRTLLTKPDEQSSASAFELGRGESWILNNVCKDRECRIEILGQRLQRNICRIPTAADIQVRTDRLQAVCYIDCRTGLRAVVHQCCC